MKQIPKRAIGFFASPPRPTCLLHRTKLSSQRIESVLGKCVRSIQSWTCCIVISLIAVTSVAWLAVDSGGWNLLLLLLLLLLQLLVSLQELCIHLKVIPHFLSNNIEPGTEVLAGGFSLVHDQHGMHWPCIHLSRVFPLPCLHDKCGIMWAPASISVCLRHILSEEIPHHSLQLSESYQKDNCKASWQYLRDYISQQNNVVTHIKDLFQIQKKLHPCNHHDIYYLRYSL